VSDYGAAEFDRLKRLLASIPAHPVAPENRRLAYLKPSTYVPIGQMYRLAAAPTITANHRPCILMHPDDLALLRRVWAHSPVGAMIDVDQEIADLAEQCFALQEAKATR
jgi:hypothetical protein